MLRSFMIDLFDREEGAAADWPLIAETLLLEAFSALDKLPEDQRRQRLLRRAEAGVYARLVPASERPAPAPRVVAGASPGDTPQPELLPSP